jgi:uncharacterized protein
MSLSIHELDPQHRERLQHGIVDGLAQKRMPPIIKIELFLTERCTLRCDYCFVATKKASRRMSWEVARKAVDFLMEQSRGEEEVTITFIGGEPLLEFPLLRRIAEYAEQRAVPLGKRMRYAVTTNGTLMTREMALFGQEHGFNYLLSVDGNRMAHDLHRVTASGSGSWDVVMGRNFDLLKSIQRWIGTRVTVSPDTVGRLSQGVRLLYERGVNQFIIGSNQDVEWSEQDLETWAVEMREVARFYADERAKGSPIRIIEFDQKPEEVVSRYAGMWGCDAGRSRLAVSCSGSLYPCSRFVSPFPGMEEKFRLGSVFEGITNVAARAELMDPTEEQRPLCRSCEYRDLCTGACPAVGLHMKGDIHAPHPLDCVGARLRAERLMEMTQRDVTATAAPA